MRVVALVLACLTCSGVAKDDHVYSKAVAKFMHAAPIPRAPVRQGIAGGQAMHEFNTAQVELLKDDLNVRLDRIQSRIEKMDSKAQQDVGAGIGEVWAFGVAGVGIGAVLLASIIQKVLSTTRNESRNDGQRRHVSLMMSMSAVDGSELQQRVPEAEEQTMSKDNDDWDPLNLADGQSNGDKVVEVQHGRLVACMIGSAGVMQVCSPAPAFAATSSLLVADGGAVVQGAVAGIGGLTTGILMAWFSEQQVNQSEARGSDAVSLATREKMSAMFMEDETGDEASMASSLDDTVARMEAAMAKAKGKSEAAEEVETVVEEVKPSTSIDDGW